MIVCARCGEDIWDITLPSDKHFIYTHIRSRGDLKGITLDQDHIAEPAA